VNRTTRNPDKAPNSSSPSIPRFITPDFSMTNSPIVPKIKGVANLIVAASHPRIKALLKIDFM
jgi:hypothetical protein